MIAGFFVLPQVLPGPALILLFLRFPMEALLVLILVLPEKIRRSWPLIPYVPYLPFCNIFILFILGPIARIVQLSPCRPIVTFHHIDTRERLSVDFHGGLAQDQSALFNSRLYLPTEFLTIACAVGKRIMPFAI
jgi:hypothetical protein